MYRSVPERIVRPPRRPRGRASPPLAFQTRLGVALALATVGDQLNRPRGTHPRLLDHVPGQRLRENGLRDPLARPPRHKRGAILESKLVHVPAHQLVRGNQPRNRRSSALSCRGTSVPGFVLAGPAPCTAATAITRAGQATARASITMARVTLHLRTTGVPGVVTGSGAAPSRNRPPRRARRRRAPSGPQAALPPTNPVGPRSRRCRSRRGRRFTPATGAPSHNPSACRAGSHLAPGHRGQPPHASPPRVSR